MAHLTLDIEFIHEFGDDLFRRQFASAPAAGAAIAGAAESNIKAANEKRSMEPLL
jgi:hypothetical protein